MPHKDKRVSYGLLIFNNFRFIVAWLMNTLPIIITDNDLNNTNIHFLNTLNFTLIEFFCKFFLLIL